MPLDSMLTMMRHAKQGGYGLGYFEAWDAYSMEAVLEVAEEESSPIILGFGGMMLDSEWLDASGVELLGAIGSHYARKSRVPVSLILNEAQTLEQTLQGIDSGFNVVMLDTSAWEWDRAVEAVSELAKIAHERGVTVEAELGRLPDATTEGIDDTTAFLTDPSDAQSFIELTGADCLAVSIGNVHLLTAHDAPVNMNHLRAIHERVSIPLVIHGGTSFPAASVAEAIQYGVAKFNVGTTLKKTFTEAIRCEVADWSPNVDVHEILGSHKERDLMVVGKRAMKERVRELLCLYGSNGRA